jgi:flagellar hook-length control protein FliK
VSAPADPLPAAATSVMQQPVPGPIDIAMTIGGKAAPDGAPAPHQPAGPPQLTQQVAGPVLSLRTAGDGNHQLTIALHPAELGPVNVHVRILGDSMTIQLASSSADAHDALREALPQLRQELQAAGLHNVDLHAVEMPAVEKHTVDLSLDLGGSTGGSGAQAEPRADQGHRPGRHDGPPADGPPVDRPAVTVPADRLVRPTDSGLDRWL